MKVFVSPNPFPGRRILDSCDDLDTSEPVQLTFTDFSYHHVKELYLQGMDIYFIVKNLEEFMNKMDMLRNLEFRIVKNEAQDNPEEQLAKRYQEVEESIKSGQVVNPKTATKLKTIMRVKSAMNQTLCATATRTNVSIVTDNKILLTPATPSPTNLSPGVEISLYPRAFDSLRTSFERSDLYLSEERLCHKIYSLLKKGSRSLKELEELGEDKEEVHNTVKSMLFGGIIEKSCEKFELTGLFE